MYMKLSEKHIEGFQIILISIITKDRTSLWDIKRRRRCILVKVAHS